MLKSPESNLELQFEWALTSGQAECWRGIACLGGGPGFHRLGFSSHLADMAPEKTKEDECNSDIVLGLMCYAWCTGCRAAARCDLSSTRGRLMLRM